MKYFCGNFDFYHISSGVSSVIFLEDLMGDCLGNLASSLCCSINFGFCIVDITPMLNAYLMKGGEQKNLNSTFELNLIFKKIK
jgi:hypothetical protein